MDHPQSLLESTQRANEAQQIFSSQTINPYFLPRTKPINPTPPTNPLKIQNLTQEEMIEHQLKGLFYNFDDKYFPENKCKKHKICMATTEDFS